MDIAQIYHGCRLKMLMELIRLLVLVKNALFQLTNVFGKIARTFKIVGLKIRSRTKTEPTVSIKAYRNYVEQKEWINRWFIGTASENN